jgi:hypothetical protein
MLVSCGMWPLPCVRIAGGTVRCHFGSGKEVHFHLLPKLLRREFLRSAE